MGRASRQARGGMMREEGNREAGEERKHYLTFGGLLPSECEVWLTSAVALTDLTMHEVQLKVRSRERCLFR